VIVSIVRLRIQHLIFAWNRQGSGINIRSPILIVIVIFGSLDNLLGWLAGRI
jgi:hypothetical protein